MAVLALEQDARLGAAVLNRENHDRSGVTHDVAASAHAAGFENVFLGDAKGRSVIDLARREHAGFGGFLTGFRHGKYYKARGCWIRSAPPAAVGGAARRRRAGPSGTAGETPALHGASDAMLRRWQSSRASRLWGREGWAARWRWNSSGRDIASAQSSLEIAPRLGGKRGHLPGGCMPGGARLARALTPIWSGSACLTAKLRGLPGSSRKLVGVERQDCAALQRGPRERRTAGAAASRRGRGVGTSVDDFCARIGSFASRRAFCARG